MRPWRLESRLPWEDWTFVAAYATQERADEECDELKEKYVNTEYRVVNRDQDVTS